MKHLRSSLKQILGGRKLVRKSKDTAIQECIQEVHEKIYSKIINPTNLKNSLNICLCLENDPQKIFSQKFLENIGELNKNQNFFFRKVLPRSIQKFIANFYIIYESKQKTFSGLERSYIDPNTLNIIAFKQWFISLLNMSERTYIDIIENSYIEDIFLDTARKLKLGRNPHNRISRIVIFGDSLSDSGILYSSFLGRIFVTLNKLNKKITLLHRSSFGRFTNGFVWCDMIAAYLMHMAENKNTDKYYTYEDILTNKLQKSKVDRFLLNYAVGGSTAGNYSFFTNVSSLQIKTILLGTVLYCLEKQVNRHLEEYTNISNNLNIIWAGPNDLVTLGLDNLQGIEYAQKGIFTCINKLKAKGAKNFLLINIPDIHIAPKFQIASQKNRNNIAWLVDKFNYDLDKKAKAENIKLFNICQVLRDLVKNNFKYYEYEGFRYDINLTNNKDGIVLLEEIKKNERYMYFDDLHPSATTHGLLGFVIAKYISKNFTIVTENATPIMYKKSC